MSNWQRTLDIKTEWKQAVKREITPQQLAEVFAERLKNLAPFHIDEIDFVKDDLIESFESLVEYDAATFDDFDNILDKLYDWGNTKLDNSFGGKKVCWIKTF